MKSLWLHITCFLLGLVSCVTTINAAETQYPSRPIRLLSPYPPGGLTDILSRLIGAKLGEAWNQQVVVDNKPGGASVIATDIVAKAAPDGHTLGMLLSPHAVNPSVIKDLPYDSVNDFVAVSLVALVPGIMTVRPSLTARSVKDVVAMAKANPGELTYASPGPLTSGHLSMELLKVLAGIDVRHIPYKGGSPAVVDLLGGRVDMMISSGGSIGPHIKSGRLVAIATTGSTRVKSLPNVPTVAESGIANYETYEWYGIFAPAKTPREVVAKLQQEVARIVRIPSVAERIIEQGADPVGNTSEEFTKFVQAEMVKWGKLAQQIKLRPE
jgi:tripartite-type tricarboxylate transporter receptor subunit TctC